ncbi:TRAF-like family protein [Raphanus sativus]|nr:TRAF-like family protein [Raphanus sativus]
MGSSSEVVSTIVKKWREHPPSSYSLKVDSFKQLEKSTSFTDDKYQSRHFSSGGYNWKLIVYPKGNEKDNGKGFISMYIEIDSESLISAPQHEQVLPFDSFNNPENGYVFEGDQCEFGVNVIVHSPLTKWEILSFNEKLQNPKFSWTVKNFSQLKEDKYTSNRFSMGAIQWVLWLYPKGDSRADGKWLSLFLLLADSKTLKVDEKILAQANLRVLHPLGSNHSEHKLNHWHEKNHMAWGWAQFLSLAELRKSYLDSEDSLTVEIEFQAVSSTKYSPII